jgi:ribosomal protein S18 acetylase RimI-like enzyme
VKVWNAQADEAPVVARLMCEFRDWWGYREPSDAEMLVSVERLLASPDADYLLAAPDGGEPSGVCQLRYRYGVWLSAEDCCLEDLYVREEARRHGLGRALVDAALERARARGCRRIELDANEGNEAAVKLYSSFGFSSYAETPGGNNLLMRLRL